MDYRLKKEKDFNKVFSKGKKIFSSHLTLIYLEENCLKVGYAVSKKHGGSVIRNRIKRILRESFRSFTSDLKQNFFFVFIPKVSKEYSLEDFKKNMEYLFKKGEFFREKNEEIGSQSN